MMRKPASIFLPLFVAMTSVLLAPPAGGAEPSSPASTIPSGAARLLSIDAAVREALRKNPSIEEANAAIRRARAGVDEARSLRLPRLDGNGRFSVQGPIPSFQFTTPPANPGQPGKVQNIAFGKTFTRHFSVGSTFDVDPFGRLRDNQAAADSGVNVSRGALYEVQNELVYAVQNVYLGALRARELIAVASEAVTAAQEQLRVAEANLRVGLVPEFDVLRARVQVSNNRQVLLTAEADYRRSLASLGHILGVEGGAPLDLMPVVLPPEPDAVAAATAREAVGDGKESAVALPGVEQGVPKDLPAALAEAFTRRPEVYQAEWRRRVAESRERFEKKGNLPSLTLSAQFNFDPDQAGLAVEEKTYSLVANIAIPIWDAGISRARARQARADADRARAQLRSARDSITEEVRRALLDLEDATGRRVSAAANTDQAREAFRIARVRYTAGLAETVEVTDAQVAYTQARANEVNAAYDYLASLAALNRALGRYAGETLGMLK